MAQKLSSKLCHLCVKGAEENVHRQARDDLYGLVQFLGVRPFNSQLTNLCTTTTVCAA